MSRYAFFINFSRVVASYHNNIILFLIIRQIFNLLLFNWLQLMYTPHTLCKLYCLQCHALDLISDTDNLILRLASPIISISPQCDGINCTTSNLFTPVEATFTHSSYDMVCPYSCFTINNYWLIESKLLLMHGMHIISGVSGRASNKF